MQRYTKTTSRTVAWLKGVADSEKLILAPPFQRNPVWTTKQQSALIETILLEYPIPELYMQDAVDTAGVEQHIVVDGQQRVRAVLEFVEGEFEISEDITRWAGASFDDLGPDERKRIFEYDFVVRVLPEMDEEQIRSIFQRINRNNIVLNGQELRHATYWGAFIKAIEDLADLEFWELSGIFTANDRRRMLDAEYVSELAIAHLNGLQNKKNKLEEYYRIYENEFGESRALKKTFNSVLSEIEAVIPEIRKTRWKKKSDFYTLFLVLAQADGILPLSAGARRDLRNVLLAFGDAVTAHLAKGEPALALLVDAEAVRKYADNVERAASDLGSRRNRRDSLLVALGPLLKAEMLTRAEMTADSSTESIAADL
jgi:hypothetical protein